MIHYPLHLMVVSMARDSEKNTIIHHPNVSYSIEGGRRIGKTSLLLECLRDVRKRIPTDQGKRIFWYDFWKYKGEDDFFVNLVRHFDEGFPKLVKGNFSNYFCQFIHRMKKKYGGTLFFFFDEVDDLIDLERKTGYPLLGLFKRLQDEIDKPCQIIMAGFRLLTEERTRYNSQISYLQPIQLGNLTRDAAIQMLRDPMASMGITIQRDVIPNFLQATGNHPFLIQIFGQALVEILDRNHMRQISLDHFFEARQGERIYSYLVENLIENTNDLELALLVSLANETVFDYEKIDSLLKLNQINIDFKHIARICKSFEAIGVISKRGSSTSFQFSIPLQPALASEKISENFLWEKAYDYHYHKGSEG